MCVHVCVCVCVCVCVRVRVRVCARAQFFINPTGEICRSFYLVETATSARPAVYLFLPGYVV